jgi:hypothetical protein
MGKILTLEIKGENYLQCFNNLKKYGVLDEVFFSIHKTLENRKHKKDRKAVGCVGNISYILKDETEEK